MENVVHPPYDCHTPRGLHEVALEPLNNWEADVVRGPGAVGTLTRTKSLLNAALRVWELKQRTSN